MKSGYVVKMVAFVPCDPMDPEGMKVALAAVENLSALAAKAGDGVEIANVSTKFVRRRSDDGVPAV